MEIEVKFWNYLKDFSERYTETIEEYNAREHDAYFKCCLNRDYWLNHCMFMNNVGLSQASKNIKILDMGTYFGLIPNFLKSLGFENVDCTNSVIDAGNLKEDLQEMWNLFDLNPIDLHIKPREHFKLDKKYDVIFATMSNIFWKNSLLETKFDEQSFFVPYGMQDLDFFIKNITEYLEPEGIAVLQPYPYVYNTFEGFKEEMNMLESFQNPHVSYEAPKSTIHSPNAELNNYFIVENKINMFR